MDKRPRGVRADLTGRLFGKWRVIGPTRNKDGIFGWLCRCACRRERIILTGPLTKGHTLGCWSCSGAHPRIVPTIAPPEGARFLLLTRGLVSLVDECDFESVSAFNWYALKTQRDGKFYAARTVPVEPSSSRSVYLHVALMNPPDGFDVDHIDGDGLNNRRYNLRVATRVQNQQNRDANSRHRKGSYKGVSRYRDKWQAKICAGPWERGRDGKWQHGSIWLGAFTDPVVAAKAYDAAALEHFGEFACLNFPIGGAIADPPTAASTV